jgi:hypothetical protein
MWLWLKVSVLRRRYLVRLHIEGQEFSLEGVLVGIEAGHYKLANARHIESPTESRNLTGITWTPRERVLFCQVNP